MGNRLEGKVAIVTGAGGGIGRAHAMILAAQGASVIVNDLGAGLDGSGVSRSSAEQVVAEIKNLGGEAIANGDNVATPDGGEAIINSAIDSFGRLDILVNNAGNYRPRMIFNMSFEDWDSVIKVHLYGHFNCIKAASKLFRAQRSGRIINTASEAWLGEAAVANYGAAKAGIVGLTSVVARDLGKYGVTCNCLCPRAATRMTATLSFDKSNDRASLGNTLESYEPEDIGPLVVYLASDAAAAVNGRVFLTYGGTVALFSDPEPIKSIHKAGRWEVDELCDVMEKTLASELVNPAPAQAG